MIREVITDPLDAADLWADLRENLRYMQHIRIGEVRLFFGYSWGKHIYEDRWVEIPIHPAQVAQRIIDAERKAFGSVGDDNFYVRIPDIEVRLEYTYETDIHLSYADENSFVARVLERWRANEWMMERQKSR
jgi:hypothetical protein